ncbi:MAG: hypothetical protein Q9201_007356 [Fulgogasparrea decipioides]
MITASAALVAGAAAHGNGTQPIQYTTEILTAYTTYCPASTQITHGGQTYTVTEATTLTITNCPCTVTKPVISTPIVYCSTCPPTSAVPVVPTTSAVIPPPISVSTFPTNGPIVPTTTPAPVVPSVPVIPSISVVPIGTGSPVAPIPITTGGPSGPGPVSPPAPPTYQNSTIPAVPGVPSGTTPGQPGNPAPSGTGASTPGSSPVTPFKGAAPKMAASGASLASLLGLAAFFL